MSNWRQKLHEMVFEADTLSGKAFDLALLVSILFGVAAVLLESVAEIAAVYGPELRALE